MRFGHRVNAKCIKTLFSSSGDLSIALIQFLFDCLRRAFIARTKDRPVCWSLQQFALNTQRIESLLVPADGLDEVPAIAGSENLHLWIKASMNVAYTAIVSGQSF